jgi:hemoglobin/transferrin/lactoferrin receptor protein
MLRHTVLALASFAVCAAAAAQDRDAGSNDLETLEKVTVTATKTPEPVGDVAATVTVIDADEIERRNAQDIRDLIRYEPGVSVSNDAGRFGLSGFTIRGLGGNRVAIEVDGVPISDAFAIGDFSNASRNGVDIDTLKQVEILRGPGSSLYGSDALAGVVSFITKDPRDYLDGDDNAFLSTKAGYASDDDARFGGFTTAFDLGIADLMAVYTHRQGHETDTQGDNGAPNSTRTEPNPQDYRDDSLLTKLVFAPREGDTLRFTAEALRSRTDTEVLSARRTVASGPSQVRTDALTGDDAFDRHRVSAEYQLETPVAVIARARALVYAQQSTTEQQTLERRTTIAASGALSPVERWRLFDFNQDSTGVEVTLQSDFATGSVTHELVYGFDYSQSDTSQQRDGLQRNLITGAVTAVVGPDAFPVRDFPNSETTETALYVQDKISFADGRFVLLPGVRWDRFELDPQHDPVFDADNPGIIPVNIRDDEISPKLGASWQLNDTWSLHGQYAHGYRAPPYNDVNVGFTNVQFGYTAIPNPDLKPETSNGIELGVRARGDLGYVALTAYRNRYDDFIESFVSLGVDPESGLLVFQSQNIASVEIEGVELRSALRLGAFSAALDGFSLNFAAAYARGEDRDTDQPLLSVDPMRATLGLVYTAPSTRWDAELIATAVDRQDRLGDDADSLFQAPGYATMDLIGRYRFNDHARVNVGLYNLADRKYWEWADVRGRAANDVAIDRYTRAGINAAVSLVLDF